MDKAYKLAVSEDFGRCLISLKNFSRGDLLWEETPMVWAPLEPEDVLTKKFTPMCVGCCKKTGDADSINCPKCQWPCCSMLCTKSEMHKNYECKVFTENRIPVTRENFEKLMFVRIVLCKSLEPLIYESILNLLDVENCRRDAYSEDKFQTRTMDVWKFLALKCRLDISLIETYRLLSMCRINSFIFRLGEPSTRYLSASLFEGSSFVTNSCVPNLHYSFVKTLSHYGDIIWNIRFYARDSIKPGDLLTMPYNANSLQYGTAVRRIRISKVCSFICMCTRCKDQTECGTYFQAIICPECVDGKGYLLPKDPIQTMENPWGCNSCCFIMEPYEARKMIRDLKRVPNSLLDKTLTGIASVKAADDFINEHSGKHLHPNHYLLLICAMHWLFSNDFSYGLVVPCKDDREELFLTIAKRAHRCIPLCLKFMNCTNIAKMFLVTARTYATFMFKSSNLETFDQGDHSAEVKLKYCRRIAAFLGDSLVWNRMNSQYGNLDLDVKRHCLWLKRVKQFEKEIEQREEIALRLLPILFLRFEKSLRRFLLH